ncbi:hypothetical protein CUD01_18460 [Cellulomonas uda]|uniref:Phage portal protein n=1 Tax=Cellulomonas uda TaxID=1714 RepID=A0A4Y3KBT4_CELUD|nr:hypothetical protein CUD01_18460 [Cellulomonas uda]
MWQGTPHPSGVGLWSRLKLAAGVGRTGGELAYPNVGLQMPWTDNTHLSRIVLSDLFGDVETDAITRLEAMRVPSIAKGRALICGTLSRQPMAKFRGAEQVDADAWLYRTDTGVSPQSRMLWTLDDLIFNGMCLWTVERDADGRITDALRVPPQWWSLDKDLNILVDGVKARADEVIFFEGPQDGLLEIGRDMIRAARNTTRAYSQRVETPVPAVELHMTDPNADLNAPEIDQALSQWEAVRRRGGTAVTPASVEVKVHGDKATDMFVEGRNAERLDAANFLALPGALLDGSTATASLTYSTQEGRRNELVDYSLSFWATPIEARLSMDDVCESGTRIAFDLAYLSTPNQPAQGPASKD